MVKERKTEESMLKEQRRTCWMSGKEKSMSDEWGSRKEMRGFESWMSEDVERRASRRQCSSDVLLYEAMMVA